MGIRAFLLFSLSFVLQLELCTAGIEDDVKMAKIGMIISLLLIVAGTITIIVSSCLLCQRLKKGKEVITPAEPSSVYYDTIQDATYSVQQSKMYENVDQLNATPNGKKTMLATNDYELAGENQYSIALEYGYSPVESVEYAPVKRKTVTPREGDVYAMVHKRPTILSSDDDYGGMVMHDNADYGISSQVRSTRVLSDFSHDNDTEYSGFIIEENAVYNK